jgi:hypothetical protein
MIRRGRPFQIVLMAAAFSVGNVVAAPPPVDCSARSANVLEFDHTNFITFCFVQSTTASPSAFYAYYSPELGNLTGYEFDTSYYEVSQGTKTFVGGAAGRLVFDKRLGRSYAQIPDSVLSGVGPLLSQWARDPFNSPTVLNRVNVRDADGCLAYAVDYAALADFIPPAVVDCANLAP